MKRYIILVTCLIATFVIQITEGIECYQFTWPGQNNITECEEDMYDQPCVSPFIITDPPNLPPNITDLNRVCQNGYCPKYKCEKAGSSCIQWRWYDLNGKLVNYTSYCGNMADVTGGSSDSISEDCFTQSTGSYEKQACVCSDNYCNNSMSLISSPYLTLLVLFVGITNRIL